MRTGQHPFGESNKGLPEWRTQIVCNAAQPVRKNDNELLQCLFFDDRRVVLYERLLCYPTRNVSQVDGYLFRYIISQTNVMSFARINVVSARMFGVSTTPPLTPAPYAYALVYTYTSTFLRQPSTYNSDLLLCVICMFPEVN